VEVDIQTFLTSAIYGRGRSVSSSDRIHPPVKRAPFIPRQLFGARLWEGTKYPLWESNSKSSVCILSLYLAITCFIWYYYYSNII